MFMKWENVGERSRKIMFTFLTNVYLTDLSCKISPQRPFKSLCLWGVVMTVVSRECLDLSHEGWNVEQIIQKCNAGSIFQLTCPPENFEMPDSVARSQCWLKRVFSLSFGVIIIINQLQLQHFFHLAITKRSTAICWPLHSRASRL